MPSIIPGSGGNADTATESVRGVLLPQELFAVTDTLPDVAPGTVVREFVCDVPDQVDGVDHVYDVAPITLVMEYVFSEP